MTTRVHRYDSSDDLSFHVAQMLLGRVRDLQSRQYLAHVCLPGGELAEAVLSRLGPLVPGSGVDPGRLELWWTDDTFTATGDASRHVQRALALLAGHFPLDPARTHPMPTPVGEADVDAAASAYVAELGPTRFDVCLLAMGDDGQVAGLTPGSRALDTSREVMGVTASPDGARIVTLTPRAINRSADVWIMAAGASAAAAVRASIDALARDSSGATSPLPAARVRGTAMTRWFVDAAAAAQLPYAECDW